MAPSLSLSTLRLPASPGHGSGLSLAPRAWFSVAPPSPLRPAPHQGASASGPGAPIVPMCLPLGEPHLSPWPPPRALATSTVAPTEASEVWKVVFSFKKKKILIKGNPGQDPFLGRGEAGPASRPGATRNQGQVPPAVGEGVRICSGPRRVRGGWSEAARRPEGLVHSPARAFLPSQAPGAPGLREQSSERSFALGSLVRPRP